MKIIDLLLNFALYRCETKKVHICWKILRILSTYIVNVVELNYFHLIKKDEFHTHKI